MRLVNDKQAAPKASLACAIGAENDDIRWQLLAKSDGRFLLMLWHDAESYSRKERRAMEVAPSPVSIDFGGKVSSLRVFMPTLAEEPQQELSTAASLKLELPDHLTIVEIVP